MESQKAKIAIYSKRLFGEKMNATFDFIKENWKVLLKFITYLLLPLSLIQSLSINGLMNGFIGSMIEVQDNTTNPLLLYGINFWISYGATILVGMVGTILLSSLLYALIQTYHAREERLVGIQLSDLRPLLMRNIGRMFKLLLFFVLLAIVYSLVTGLLLALTPFSLILTLPLLFALMIPMALFAPIYLFEKIRLMKAFTKTLRLGFATWGGIFLFGWVLYLIAGMLQGITMMPWYIATVVKYFFVVSEGGGIGDVSSVYSFFLYLLGVIQVFGAYLSMVILCIGMVYQYGHASEVVDSVSVADDIENFDKL